jgi:pyruvate/2-oxoglutarate dehydrogenase complex dihydrolipoamide dehydrogenase (E3) component
MSTYDMIVIGGGTAGLVAAAGAAGIGARVALIERDRLGGECLWTGCVPSKALIAAARAAIDRRGDTDGRASGPDANFGRVIGWMRDAQARIAPHDSPERFRGLGVDVVPGDAVFSNTRTLTAGGRTFAAKRIVIATGSAPAVPPIEGLDGVTYFTNETIFSLERQPADLLVLGAGPVGLELAQAFARLGTRVQVVEAGDALLPHEDEELGGLLADALRAGGVELHLGIAVNRAVQDDGHIRLIGTASGGGEASFDGDTLLVATGRVARTETLDLSRAGVEATHGGITVDAGLRTTADGVWAAGDCVGPLRFTHVADYQARLVIRNAFFPFRARADYSAVPWVTFTDPELAHVGLTEREARERYGDSVRIWKRPFRDVDRAIIDGNTSGMVKLITARRGKIVGGHILGHGAGDMIAEITLAMKHGISAGTLGNTIHAYPTYAEGIKQAAEEYTKARFTGAVKRIVNWYVRR